MRTLLLLALLPVACATTQPQVNIPGEPPPISTPASLTPPPPPPPPPVCTSFARPGVLRRSLVVKTVDAGMGRWLAAGGVIVDPFMQKGRFRGWIVRKLYPDDPCYKEIDLRPGDVVLKVNGKGLERPEQADEVFRSLTRAPALVVELARAGAPMKLTFPIVEE